MLSQSLERTTWMDGAGVPGCSAQGMCRRHGRWLRRWLRRWRRDDKRHHPNAAAAPFRQRADQNGLRSPESAYYQVAAAMPVQGPSEAARQEPFPRASVVVIQQPGVGRCAAQRGGCPRWEEPVQIVEQGWNLVVRPVQAVRHQPRPVGNVTALERFLMCVRGVLVKVFGSLEGRSGATQGLKRQTVGEKRKAPALGLKRVACGRGEELRHLDAALARSFSCSSSRNRSNWRVRR